MKKFLITLAALGSMVATSNAATFVFNTDAANLNLHVVYTDVAQTMRATGPNIVGQIYMSTSMSGTFEAVGNSSAFLEAGTGGEGFINAGTQSFSTLGGNTVFGGDTVFYYLAAWDSTTGSTFDTATLRGVSDIQSIVAGGPKQDTGMPAQLPSTVNTFSSFNLSVVPEPTVFVLGLMGGLGFLFRRRR